MAAWLLCVPALIVAGWIILFNWWVVIALVTGRSHRPSPVAFVGGLTGALGLYLLPAEVSPAPWLALIVDPGSAGYLVFLLWLWARGTPGQP